VSEARRIARATADFFQDLDRQLRPERGPDGEPSANDFQVFELIRIVDRFATEFDELPELIPGRPDYRLLISNRDAGRFAADGAVELGQLDLDLADDD